MYCLSVTLFTMKKKGKKLKKNKKKTTNNNKSGSINARDVSFFRGRKGRRSLSWDYLQGVGLRFTELDE